MSAGDSTALARGSTSAPEQALLAFELGSEHYAVPLARVREIMRLPEIAEVPRAPDGVLGVIYARGAVTTLLDLRRRLRLAEAPVGPRSRVLLVTHQEEVLAMLVDSVLGVRRLVPAQIEPASALGAAAPVFLQGIGRPADSEPSGMLLLLDLDPILALDRSITR